MVQSWDEIARVQQPTATVARPSIKLVPQPLHLLYLLLCWCTW